MTAKHVFHVHLEGDDGAARDFAVRAANPTAALDRALDEVTGDGEFWPPNATVKELEPIELRSSNMPSWSDLYDTPELRDAGRTVASPVSRDVATHPGEYYRCAECARLDVPCPHRPTSDDDEKDKGNEAS